jgi:DNA-binding NtrC family response regulator
VARQGTWTDDGGRADARAVVVLSYVLSYDDLAGDEAWSVPIDDGVTITIGRDDDAVVPGAPTSGGEQRIGLGDRWASSKHASLQVSDGGGLLCDLGSRNGTWVNGEKVTERMVQDRDLVEIGRSLFVIRRVRADLAERVRHGDRRMGPTRTFSPEVARLVDDLRRIARSRDPVLVLAETGAGKESLAETVHALSFRKGPLVRVDAGAIPENLFESTFFGHRKGAFTGADLARTGLIAQADRGTLFLDEVGNLALAAQAKLLRAIETGLVTPVGANDPEKVDVRWIAATNRDLFGDRTFRPDLLRRLAGYVARLPPLRDRREDLGTIAAHVLREAGATRVEITTAAARRLLAGPLPGNVRQLRAALRSAVLLAAGGPIDVEHLPEDLRGEADEDVASVRPGSLPPGPNAPAGIPGPAAKARRPTAEELTRVLADARGNVVHAAEHLGTHPRQVYRWIERYGLDLEALRGG